MAWSVAHLLVLGGHMRRGTRVDGLMRLLLGRAPGTLPGESTAEPLERELSPEASATFIKAWVMNLKPRHLRVRE